MSAELLAGVGVESSAEHVVSIRDECVAALYDLHRRVSREEAADYLAPRGIRGGLLGYCTGRGQNRIRNSPTRSPRVDASSLRHPVGQTAWRCRGRRGQPSQTMLACHPKPKSGSSFPDARFTSRHGMLVRSASRSRRARRSTGLLCTRAHPRPVRHCPGAGWGSALHRAGRAYRKCTCLNNGVSGGSGERRRLRR